MELDVFTHICKHFDLKRLVLCSKVCKLWYLSMKRCLDVYEYKLKDVALALKNGFHGLWRIDLIYTSQLELLLRKCSILKYKYRIDKYHVGGHSYTIVSRLRTEADGSFFFYSVLEINNEPDYLVNLLMTVYRYSPTIQILANKICKEYKVRTINKVSQLILEDYNLVPKFSIQF